MTRTKTETFPAILPRYVGDGKGLSREDEVRLFGLLATASREAAAHPDSIWPDRKRSLEEYIVSANLKLCRHWANRSARRADLAEELYSIALSTLLYTLSRYDTTRGGKFSTYASCAIRNAMSQESQRRASRAKIERIAKQDIEDTRCPPAPCEDRDERAKLEAALQSESLTEQERKVIRYVYLSPSEHRPTLKQTGIVFGVSNERVRQVMAKALLKLKLILTGKGGRAASISVEDVVEDARQRRLAR
jgi:RNA polymerase sigma factor (sigma-70 family)